MIQSFKDLEIYQKSKKLLMDIYKITEEYPEQEKFNVISQLRRSVLSIPLNIAEGYGRKSKEDFKRFLKISLGSSNEVEALLEISKELNYLEEKEYQNLSKENSSLDKSDIKELNNNYYQELKRLNLFSEELTYLSDDKYQDDNYIGRFVSEEGYTYQFTINITNNTVKIIEIAQIQIDRENLEHNYGGIGG